MDEFETFRNANPPGSSKRRIVGLEHPSDQYLATIPRYPRHAVEKHRPVPSFLPRGLNHKGTLP